MCLFPLPNTNYSGLAYKKGVLEFDCGACPECLRKRSNIWALRCVYESKQHAHNCMITLTYDTFAHDDRGNIIGENPVNPDLVVNRRHVQLFIKRLRKWWSTVSGTKIKVFGSAEYGSRTHRAHYHLILFGVKFPDAHYYKKSKRGNVIYMSSILTKLWGHGICTIDSQSIHSGIARYCSKYCSKTRSDETFFVCSHHIGFDGLLKDFNGKSYIIDGREYPIPRFIWETYIVNKYQRKYLFLKNAPLLSPKYVNRDRTLSDFDFDFYYERSKRQRAFYRRVRDKDKLYRSYLDYWHYRGSLFNSRLLPVVTRLNLLPDDKYHFYKAAAFPVLQKRLNHIPYPAPASNCISAYERYKFNLVPRLCPLRIRAIAVTLSRPYTAIDTTKPIINPFSGFAYRDFNEFQPILLKNLDLQLSFFD